MKKNLSEAPSGAELFFKNLLETVSQPLAVLDEDMRVAAANRSFHDKFEISGAEAKKTSLFDPENERRIFPERLRDILADVLKKNARFENFELTCELPRAGRRQMRFTASRLEYQKAKFALLAAEDVSASEKTLQIETNLLDSIGQAVIATDINGRIIFWNKFAEKLYGWKATEVLSRNILEIAPAKEMIRHAEEIASRLREGESWSGEFTLQRRDGTTFPGFVTSAPVFDENGEMTSFVGVSFDITERKNFERKLIMEKSLAEAIVDGMPGLFYLFDRSQTALRWNKNLEKVSGYTSEEIAKMKPLDFLDGSEKYTINEITELAFELGEFAFEANLKTKDGTKIPHFFSVKPLFFDGEPCFLGTATDISERIRAKNALRKSKEHLALAQQVAMMGSFEWDLKTNVMDSSAELEALYGLPPGGLKAGYDEWIKYVHPEDLPKVEQNIQTAVSTGKFDHELRIRRTDGEIRWLYDKGQVFYNEEGKPARMVGVSMDITEKKLAEEKLQRANERALQDYERLLQRLATLAQALGVARDLKAVFSAILDFTLASVPCIGLFISEYDPEKSERKGIYFWFNGREVDVSDLAPVAVGDGPVGRAIKRREVLIFNDYNRTAGKKPQHVFLGFDEDPRYPLSTLVSPMKTKGEVIGVIEVQSYELDVYTREHATAMRMAANLVANAIENVRLFEQERLSAEQLRLSQKLESVGRLAGGIAHDFNNMLTAINGYSELTLRNLSSDNPLRRNIEEIKKAGERSAMLTHQLLAFSRKQVLKPEILDINQIVTDIAAMLRRLISEDIILNIKLEPKIWKIVADPGQLAQVIMNLVVNARDAMPEGGELTIETSNVRLDENFRHTPTQPGSYVKLSISDTGIGMDEETQQHIFEPFFTTKETGKGTGLGLSTVYGIIKQSGGYIWFQSRPGQGTSFNVYLPRVDENPVPVQEENDIGQNPDGAGTILLVEDEDMVRELICKILETHGYKVIEARSGAEALSICSGTTSKIDLLITDVVMPQISGRQLVEKLADSYPDLKVLYISGYNDDEILRQGITDLSTNFIQKPFSSDALTQKVGEILNHDSGNV